MTKSMAEILRVFSIGMFAYYVSSIGLAIWTYQFAIVMTSVVALHFLGQFLGYLHRVSEEKEALHAGVYAAIQQSGAFKYLEGIKVKNSVDPQN